MWPVASNDATFASFRSGILPKLLSLTSADDASELERLSGYFSALDATSREVGATGGHGLALRRRLSREAGPFSRIVELGACLFNKIVERSQAPGILLADVSAADAGTLVLLARASVLRAEGSKNVAWWSRGLFPGDSDDSPLKRVRLALIQRVLVTTRIKVEGDVTQPVEAPVCDGPFDISAATTALLHHNYPRAVQICGLLAGDAGPSDRARLEVILGLASTSYGDFASAAASFEFAASTADDPRIVAHACFLRALLATKRAQQLDVSDRFLKIGFESLAGLEDDAARLERAWLYNCEALNKVTRFRRDGHLRDWLEAQELERAAFALVRDIAHDEGAYLRHNLLANTSLLYSIHPEPRIKLAAAGAFKRTFKAMPLNTPVAQATLYYRLAMSHLAAGELDAAGVHLQRIPLDQLPHEEWPLVECVLYARAYLACTTGNSAVGALYFEAGAKLAFDSRSRASMQRHVAGLSFATGGSLSDTVRRLAAAESLDLATPRELDKPRTKLPPYYPEIDLEDVPPFDTNQIISDAR